MSRIAIYTQFNEPFRKVANLTIPVMQEYDWVSAKC
jgi:hypothetical protein